MTPESPKSFHRLEGEQLEIKFQDEKKTEPVNPSVDAKKKLDDLLNMPEEDRKKKIAIREREEEMRKKSKEEEENRRKENIRKNLYGQWD
jgi:acetyl-CoA carboxylase carboxyltransferase component